MLVISLNRYKIKEQEIVDPKPWLSNIRKLSKNECTILLRIVHSLKQHKVPIYKGL